MIRGVQKVLERIREIEARFGFSTTRVSRFRTKRLSHLIDNAGGVEGGPSKMDSPSTSRSVDAKKDTPSQGGFRAVLERSMRRREGGSEKCERVSSPSEGSEKEARLYLDRLIARCAEKYGLSAALISAIVKAESNFDPNAISRKGAMGLMQLMPATALELGVKDPFDPEENLDGGVRYLIGLLSRYDHDLTLALSAYNAGPGRVDRAGGVPNIPETREFVHRVLSYYENYKGRLDQAQRQGG